MTVTPTPEQAAVISSIISYFSLPPSQRPPYLTLGGYAGTGKTTLLSLLPSLLPGTPIICSPTGKAASVLRSKGLSSASTIHSTIYRTTFQSNHLHFSLLPRNALPGSYFIIDEASMISSVLLRDLLSFSLPILFVGDHGQLEPVGDSPNLMSSPTLRLETILRQALTNPIIPFAHHLRNNLLPSSYLHPSSPSLRILSRQDPPPSLSGQIICAYNRTRILLNTTYRRALSYSSLLHPSERIICLRNNRDLGLFNGQIFTVTRILSSSPSLILADLLSPDSIPYPSIPLCPSSFNSAPPSRVPRDPPAYFDYAYAITCHKAQGSEWPSVIVYDEPGSPYWTPSRWRYTAATRATTSLTYFH
jgi:exodeoxyribonuclease V